MSELKCIEHYTGIIRGRLKDIERNARDQDQKITELESERDELRGKLEGVELKLSYREGEVQSLLDTEGSSIPCVITADELKAGTAIATFADDGFPVAGVVTGHAAGEFSLLMHSDMLQTFSVDRTLMFLADAPEPAEPEVTAETIRNSAPGSTWEDKDGVVHEWTGNSLRLDLHYPHHGPANFLENDLFEDWSPWTRSTAAPRGTYPKRLTVEDLDAAEVGSVLRLGGLTSKKREDGWGQLGASAEQMITASAIGWSHATLTLPEKPERRGEVIQPEDLREGDIYDAWTGGGKCLVRGIKRGRGPLWQGLADAGVEVRLVDRPEPELPTEPGSVVLVTELQGQKIDPPIKALRDDEDLWMGVSAFPDGGHAANSDEITGFKPARIVVEDGA